MPIQSIYFSETTGPNIYPLKWPGLCENNRHWPSTSVFYQAQKLRNDPGLYHQYYRMINRELEPMVQSLLQERLSKHESLYTSIWDTEAQKRALQELVLRSVLGNPSVQQSLVDTYPAVLIFEGSKIFSDKFGINAQGEGDNLLGTILMQVRQVLMVKYQARPDNLNPFLELAVYAQRQKVGEECVWVSEQAWAEKVKNKTLSCEEIEPILQKILTERAQAQSNIWEFHQVELTMCLSVFEQEAHQELHSPRCSTR